MIRFNNIQTIAISFLCVAFASCDGNSMDELLTECPTDNCCYSLLFDAEKPSFDDTEENTTRAYSNRWENGDRIYFYSTSESKAGYADLYNGEWTLHTYSSLNDIDLGYCYIYYFRGDNVYESGSRVNFGAQAAQFQGWGEYSKNGSSMAINVHLSPKTFRFRLKGPSYTDIELSTDDKIWYNSSWDHDTNLFWGYTGTQYISTSWDGYTPYIYGEYYGYSSTIKLTLKMNGIEYTRNFSTSQLEAGAGSKNSGYFNLPTSSNLNGWTKIQKGPDFNGHDYVDLGLKDDLGRTIYWATCNVGASSPEDYGWYFAWGETVGYTQYEYHYFDWEHYKWCNGNEYSMTKYCTDSYYGTVDNKTNLSLSDDAAHANWGGDWRMPTRAEQDQLRIQCQWTWDNTKKGYTVKGPNGNRIFLPAAGYRFGTSLLYAGLWGEYWSSSLCTYFSPWADDLYFFDSNVNGNSHTRYYGQSIRAVCVSSE